MISSDQEDSPADRPLSDRTNIETAGEHDGELLAKKREEGRERTRLCRERKKAAKQKDENPPGEHEDPLLAERRADQREWTRLCRERKKAAKQNENNLPGGEGKSTVRYAAQSGIEEIRVCFIVLLTILEGGKENQQADLLPNSSLGSSQTIQKSRKCGFGDVISLEIASDKFQNEATSRANKRGALFVPALDDTQISTPVSRHIGLTPLSSVMDPKLGGKENQQADLQPYPLLGSSRTIQRLRKRGFGHVISLETASEKFQNKSTSRANKRGVCRDFKIHP
ncbi:hypothetical protein EJB05_23797 [Eragrostis curvula]|uniref:Uncharacterized protein n=1 Tax=Eragrostis curvula TaxID=38414 RepID=A0A5J9V7K6_9POAL|nr:hypothetical protein EJB05_23797 [Eragrostis curvula]